MFIYSIVLVVYLLVAVEIIESFQHAISRYAKSPTDFSNIHRHQPNIVQSADTKLKEKDIDIYENEIILSDEDDDDNMEDDMALETFNELSFNTESLSLQAFLEWDDIQDVLSRGVVDRETINIIVKEVGIRGGFMSFVQFKELVELINQVSTALEQNTLDEDDDDENDDESLTELERIAKSDTSSDSTSSDNDDTAKWIEAQLNKMDRS